VSGKLDDGAVYVRLQSEEDAWNYAQTGGNMCSGRKTPFDDAALVFLGKSPDRIGPVNIKARYVEYTDATFKHIRVRFLYRLCKHSVRSVEHDVLSCAGWAGRKQWQGGLACTLPPAGALRGRATSWSPGPCHQGRSGR
jgi:hypothetical protein